MSGNKIDPEGYLKRFHGWAKRLGGEYSILHALAEIGEDDSKKLWGMISDSVRETGDPEMSIRKLSFFNPSTALQNGERYSSSIPMNGKIYVFTLDNYLVFRSAVPDKVRANDCLEGCSTLMPYDIKSNSFLVKRFEGTLKAVFRTPLEINERLFMLWWRDDGCGYGSHGGSIGNNFFCLDGGIFLAERGAQGYSVIISELDQIIEGRAREALKKKFTVQEAKILRKHFFDNSSHWNINVDLGRAEKPQEYYGWIEVEEGLAEPTVITVEKRQWGCIFCHERLWVWPIK